MEVGVVVGLSDAAELVEACSVESMGDAEFEVGVAAVGGSEGSED